MSSTLSEVDWNAEPVQGDLARAVQRLKQEPGEGLWVGGVTLPLALADLGLIDEYEFLVHPVLAGHGPMLLAGLREHIQLELVDRHELRSGAAAVRYRPTRRRRFQPDDATRAIFLTRDETCVPQLLCAVPQSASEPTPTLIPTVTQTTTVISQYAGQV